MNRQQIVCALTFLLLVVGCGDEMPDGEGDPSEGAAVVDIDRRPYGTTPEGEEVDLFTLTNSGGMEVGVVNYGGVITSIRVPDRAGVMGEVVLGYDNLEAYLDRPFFSSLIGRYANRIAAGRFTLDGREYSLAVNNGPNHLHGGPGGFHQVVWSAQPFQTESTAGVVLTYMSPDGEEGFPGTVETRVTYTLNDQDELIVEYHAITDAPTIINLTHHAYFNLSGDPTEEVLNHELTLHASRMTLVDETLIPTGEIVEVAGTPFDFTQPMAIGARIDDEHEQLTFGRGYDHTWILDRAGDAPPTLAARLDHPPSGRVLEVLTDKPGIQVYTGRRTGVALETHYFPDSPNHPHFPSPVLRPGEEYRHTTVFRFSNQGG